MPHAGRGTQHSCPGASGAVSLKNGNVIPAGGCRWARDPRYCWIHNYICLKHQWIYTKKDTCTECDNVREYALPPSIEIRSNSRYRAKKSENRKRKKDDDDDEEEDEDKKPVPKRITKKDRKRGAKATTKNTEKIIAKKQSSKTKKDDTKQALVGLILGDIDSHWSSWMSGQKTIDLDRLVKDLTPASSNGDSDDVFNGLTERAALALQVILPYLVDDDGMTVLESLQATFESAAQVSYQKLADLKAEVPDSPTHSHQTRSRGLEARWQAFKQSVIRLAS
ncbi:uncharacterized protein PAC_03470 [Phialocephala subalpina]|uniref:Uncharacterized protein n=1 Tax=Phialocephala subalpina TaxID=576137 RepID=A0A1L7WLF0_9HELO|nr:uncharacterized protein PAC_03470 [Phialocephala subalpina]